MTPLFLSSGSLSLGLTSICLRVLLPLKCVLLPYFQHLHLILPPGPAHIGLQCVPYWVLPLGMAVVWLLLLGPLLPCVVLLAWVLPLSSWLPFITLFCTLFMAHLGYLHLTNAFLRCCNSSSKSPGMVQTDLAL